jgi:hypothetical protein
LEKFDLAIVANPALRIGLPFAASVALRRKPSITFINDVYPDVGTRLIVGAGSMVSRDVPSNTIVAGNPASSISTE